MEILSNHDDVAGDRHPTAGWQGTGLKLSTGEIGHATGKDRHATRRTELTEPHEGGGTSSTPLGIRQLALWDVTPEEVEGFFVEFRPFVALCRFLDCSHTYAQ